MTACIAAQLHLQIFLYFVDFYPNISLEAKFHENRNVLSSYLPFFPLPRVQQSAWDIVDA